MNYILTLVIHSIIYLYYISISTFISIYVEREGERDFKELAFAVVGLPRQVQNLWLSGSARSTLLGRT